MNTFSVGLRVIYLLSRDRIGFWVRLGYGWVGIRVGDGIGLELELGLGLYFELGLGMGLYFELGLGLVSGLGLGLGLGVHYKC